MLAGVCARVQRSWVRSSLWQHFLGDYDFAFARRGEGTVFAVFRLVGSALVELPSCCLSAHCVTAGHSLRGSALGSAALRCCSGSRVSDGAVESFGVGAVISLLTIQVDEHYILQESPA